MSDIKKDALAIDGITDVVGNIATTPKELHPRILFINCDQYAQNNDIQIESNLACSLKSEGWVANSFTYSTTVKSDQNGDLITNLIYRFREKFLFLRNLIRELPKYEIVHIECSTPRVIIRLAMPALLLAKFFGRRSLLYFPSSEAEQFFEKSARWYLPILRLADITIVSSRYLQKLISRIGLKCSRFDHPVNLSKIEHRIVSDLQPKILLFSPLEEEYDIQVSIRAFALVKQKYPRAEMLIAGDGSERISLEDLVSEKRVLGIDFIGYRKVEELPQLVESCDIYLSSAIATEPTLPLIAAFAAGLPVVCTDADGLNQTVKDRVNALVVPVGDHVALADSLIELIENSELTRELSLKGWVEASRYSWSKVRVNWLRFFDNLADSHLTN